MHFSVQSCTDYLKVEQKKVTPLSSGFHKNMAPFDLTDNFVKLLEMNISFFLRYLHARYSRQQII